MANKFQAAAHAINGALHVLALLPEEPPPGTQAQWLADRAHAAEGIVRALYAADVTQAELLRGMGRVLPAPKWAIKNATTHYSDGVEIDHPPLASETDDGCWISGWIWAPKPAEECAVCGCEIEDGAPDNFTHDDKWVCAACHEEATSGESR